MVKAAKKTPAKQPQRAAKKRSFEVTITTTIWIDLDEAVIDSVDDTFRKQFFPDMHTPEEIAAHIGYNMAINELPLDMIDGFAQLPRGAAERVDLDWQSEAKELPSKKVPA